MKNKILLIDGMALLFRHFYATSINHHYMRNKEGTPTNGVQGFVRHTFSAIHDIQPTHIAVCWDMGKATFRNEIFDGYKQNRPSPPSELIPQFDHVQAVSRAFGFANIGVENFEADDVMGTLARQLSDENDVFIVTGDRDLLQCINPNVEVWLVKKGFNLYDRFTLDRFRDVYGVEPKQLIDIKAFMGDTADGYPGVKGVGEKTALKFITQYQSVENVLANLEALTPTQRKKIEAAGDALHLAKQLATIHTEVPVNAQTLMADMELNTTVPAAIDVCNTHELFVSSKYLADNFLD